MWAAVAAFLCNIRLLYVVLGSYNPPPYLIIRCEKVLTSIFVRVRGYKQWETKTWGPINPHKRYIIHVCDDNEPMMHAVDIIGI